MSTSDRFSACLAFTLKEEGGYVNNPADPGGATNQGITQAAYDAYRHSQGQPPALVRNITAAEVQAIYLTNYWQAMQCGSLPAPIDLCVFDFGVNAGPVRAVRYLQIGLGITADGQIGPETLAAAGKAAPQALADRLLQARCTYYRQIVAAHPDQAQFLDGWLERVAHLRAVACS